MVGKTKNSTIHILFYLENKKPEILNKIHVGALPFATALNNHKPKAEQQ